MTNLIDIYNSVKNPINDKKILEQLLLEYEKSLRTEFKGGGMYGCLVKLNSNSDNSLINQKDKENFMVESYNQYIKNILTLSYEQLQILEKSGMEAMKVKQYLTSFGKVNSMQDIQRLKSNPLFKNEMNNWELNNGWDHIKSRYITARQEQKIDVKHRLYIGCQNQDIWKIMSLFKEKCEKNGTPYYFKSAYSVDRDDKIVIYADTDNLANYIDSLQEIAKENPEIINRCGNPPVLTGTINNWIGIGDEPSKKQNGKNLSYNQLRANVLENSIEEALLKDIIEFKGKEVIYNGEKTKFNDIFINNATQYLVGILDVKCKKKGINSVFEEYGVNNEEIKAGLRNQISKGFKKLDEVKDKKETLLASNSKSIFNIPTPKGNGIDVNITDMDHIIKTMVPLMQQIDSQFLIKVQKNIEEKCQQFGIDSRTFCFEIETRKRFEQVIKTSPNILQSKSSNSSQKSKESNEERKIKFIQGFIQAYDDTEEKYQYENRASEEQLEIERVQEIIKTNGLNRMLTSDLEGKWLGTTQDKDFKVQYSQKQVSAMVQLLKAAQLLTDNKKLNTTSKNYLEEFSGVADIEYKLKQMENDLKDNHSYMFELKNKAIENRISGNIPNFPKTDGEIDISTNSSHSGQVLKQEMGITQAQADEKQKNKYKGEKYDAQKISIKAIKELVEQSKVTKSELYEQTKNMSDITKIKSLKFKQICGLALNPDEQNLLNEHIRQTNQIQFQQEQEKKKKSFDMRSLINDNVSEQTSKRKKVEKGKQNDITR